MNLNDGQARADVALPEASPSGRSPSAGSTAANDVAARAYELYQLKGGDEGHDLEDWLQAERVIGLHRLGRESANE